MLNAPHRIHHADSLVRLHRCLLALLLIILLAAQSLENTDRSEHSISNTGNFVRLAYQLQTPASAVRVRCRWCHRCTEHPSSQQALPCNCGTFACPPSGTSVENTSREWHLQTCSHVHRSAVPISGVKLRGGARCLQNVECRLDERGWLVHPEKDSIQTERLSACT
eukprot:490510-Rhodomonas_salina.1